MTVMNRALAVFAVLAGGWNLSAQAGAYDSHQVIYQPATEQTQPSPQVQPEQSRPDVPEPEPPVQPPPQPTETVQAQLTPFQALLQNRQDFLLARTPPMLGDTFGTGITLSLSSLTTSASGNIPLGGGNRRFSVADNNIAVPVDRAYFAYNHFRNAIATSFASGAGFGGQTNSINQYTFGYERTFGGFQNSLEVRIPFVNQYDFLSPTYGVAGGSVGNLFLNYKRILARSDEAVLSWGVGLGIPTGSNALALIDDDVIKVHNDAVHFTPFLGLVGGTEFDNSYFYHAFAQFDFPTNGNKVQVVPGGDPTQSFRAGRIDDKDLFRFDVGVGTWLFRDRYQNRIHSMAAIAEIHYLHAFGGGDSVSAMTPNSTFITASTPSRDSHILNLTTGVDAQIGPLTNLRFATVFPLRDGNNLHRAFDAEVLVSLIRYL
jgi:hypothetical protein